MLFQSGALFSSLTVAQNFEARLTSGGAAMIDIIFAFDETLNKATMRPCFC